MLSENSVACLVNAPVALNDLEHVLSAAPNLFAYQNEVVIRSFMLICGLLGPAPSWLSHFFASRVRLLFSYFEHFEIRGVKLDLSSYFRVSLWSVGPEDLQNCRLTS